MDLDKSDTYTWTITFLNELKKRRKFALRLGELSEYMSYNLRPDVTRALCAGKRKIEDLTENDFIFNAQQKGVDMKIGLDIASLAYKHQVDQIILIAGAVSYTHLDVYKRQVKILIVRIRVHIGTGVCVVVVIVVIIPLIFYGYLFLQHPSAVAAAIV